MSTVDPFGSQDELELQPLPPVGSSTFPSVPAEFDIIMAETVLPSSDPFFDFDNATPPISGLPLIAATVHEIPPQPAEVLSEEEIIRRRHWRKVLLGAVPSWLISLVLHVILVIILALISLDPVGQVLSILESSGNTEETNIDEFELDGPQPLETPENMDESVTLPEPASAPKMEMAEVQQLTTLPTSATVIEPDALSSNVLDRSLLASSAKSTGSMLKSRSSASKNEMLERFGGSAASEKSVALALKWFATHQVKSGPKAGVWSFNHNVATRKPSTGQGDFADSTNAATALALLPFLGAGQTHMEGQYKDTVKLGLASLIRNMQLKTEDGVPCGSWHERRGNMYSHGLATIAICEAYAMTHDPDLLQPAQLALNYIVVCQDPRGGGWRYNKQQAGDTSVVGWCLMGLKSGRMGNLSVPPASFVRTSDFLDMVGTDNGAFYGYSGPVANRNYSMTSVGLLCRMYLGWPKEHPGVQAGIKYLSSVGPKVDNLYYTYYGTQIMRHHGGDAWDQWNKKLRDSLIALQVTEGTDAGSWEPQGPHSKSGGRLYQTSLATMILEVYYRHLPLYSDKSLEDEFEI